MRVFEDNGVVYGGRKVRMWEYRERWIKVIRGLCVENRIVWVEKVEGESL